MSIPVLKLPGRAFLTVLQVMGFIDLFVLTRVSKRMKGIVKEKVKVHNHTLTIYFHKQFGFITELKGNEDIIEAFIVEQKNPSESVQFSGEIGSFKQVPIIWRPTINSETGGNYPTIETYWDDMLVGMKELYEELTQLFPMPFNGMKINLSAVGGNYRSAITWFNSLHLHVPDVEVKGENCEFGRYLYAMKHLKPIEQLTMNARPSGYYETGPIKFSTKELFIDHASWIHLGHIREMKSTYIVLGLTNFTDEEINELFCSLKDGYNSGLEELVFSIRRNADRDTFLRNLNATEFDEDSWSFILAGRRRCALTYKDEPNDPNFKVFRLTIERLPRLPLLKLPDLAFVKVLETMKILNLFIFSNLSKRMKKIVKAKVKIRNHKLTIFMEKKFGFMIQSTKNTELFGCICIKPAEKRRSNCRMIFFENIGEMRQIPFGLQEYTNKIWTIWNEQIVGMREMYNEISTLFPMPLTGIRMNLNFIGDEFPSIISWINNFNPKVPVIEVDGENCEFHLLTSTIEQVFTKNLLIFATGKEYLETEELNTNADRIHIWKGRWIKVKHLKSLSSSQIEIENSSLKDKEINEFLRLLKGGSNPNLKKLMIQFVRHLNLTTIMEGLEATGVDAVRRFQLDNGKWCKVAYWRIQQNPGLRELRIKIKRRAPPAL